MPEPANTYIKGEKWSVLLRWLIANKDEPDLLLVVSAQMPDPRGPSEVHTLGTLAGFRPTGRDDDDHHRACALIICRRYHERGLINLKIGRSQDTALLRAVTVGNYEIAEMFARSRCRPSPLCYPVLFYSGASFWYRLSYTQARGHALSAWGLRWGRLAFEWRGVEG